MKGLAIENRYLRRHMQLGRLEDWNPLVRFLVHGLFAAGSICSGGADVWKFSQTVIAGGICAAP
jgi:hypothetical protein